MSAARIAALSLLVATAMATAAAAHPLDVGTARVTLRDQHLEVTADLDLMALARIEPTALATSDEAALDAEWVRLQRALGEGTQLQMNGVVRPLVVTGFPSAAELRALAAMLSATGRLHGERVRVRLECEAQMVEARTVSLALPEALGPVLVTFVQPASHYTAPGHPAIFAVLERAAMHASPTGSPTAIAWMALPVAVLLALALLGGLLIGQRRTMGRAR